MTIGNRNISGGHIVLLALGGFLLAGVAGLLLVALWKGISFAGLLTFGVVLSGDQSDLSEEVLLRIEVIEEIRGSNNTALEEGGE